MEVHDNTAHIKLNENSIVSFMGNDGEGSMAALPSAPLETGDAVGSMDVQSSAPPEPGDMESNPVVGLLPTVPPGSRDDDVGPTVPPTSPQGTSGTGEENGPVVQPFVQPWTSASATAHAIHDTTCR